MKHNKLVTALAAAGLVAGAGNLAADGDQPFHVTGQLGSLYTDSARNTRDDDVWWSIGVGYFFNDNFSLDLEYDRFEGTWNDYATVSPNATFDQWGLKNIGLMSRYYFTSWGMRENGEGPYRFSSFVARSSLTRSRSFSLKANRKSLATWPASGGRGTARSGLVSPGWAKAAARATMTSVVLALMRIVSVMVPTFGRATNEHFAID